MLRSWRMLPIWCSRRTAKDEGNTGNFYIDEEVLRANGITDFDPYAIDPSAELMPDFFL